MKTESEVALSIEAHYNQDNIPTQIGDPGVALSTLNNSVLEQIAKKPTQWAACTLEEESFFTALQQKFEKITYPVQSENKDQVRRYDGRLVRCMNESDTFSGRPKADEFGRAVSKIAVSQICESVGYQGFKASALEAFADVSIRFLCDLGKNASFHANLAGRTECNLFDMIQGLEDLGAPLGFPGASEFGVGLIGSGIVNEIIHFVGSHEEIPFAQAVPHFPVVRNSKLIPSFDHMNETPPGKHIPTWLPAFPDPHTYIHTPMWNERASDPRVDKSEQARQRRKAERALLNLQQRLVYNGSTVNSVSALLDTKKEKLQETGNNPFLAAPSQPGEKDVSEVVLPTKLSGEVSQENHFSVLETFAPAIEAIKGGPSSESDAQKMLLPEKRPSVHFKFKTGGKIFGESLDWSLQKKGERRTAFFLRDEERDDKKRRAEFILRQTTEYPMELNQS